MKLIVGLGNPGKEYENTRHNSGFKVIDFFCDKYGVDCDIEDFKGIYGKFTYKGDKVFVFKPTTFMNLSGMAVQAISHYFKIDVNDIIIVFDDMSISVGHIKMKPNGSSGGQKGMQNIIENLGTSNIKRIKIGIGEPEHNPVDYVLGKPSGEEKVMWEKAIEKASNAIKETLESTFDKAMSLYNN